MTFALGALVFNLLLQLVVISGAGTGKLFPLALGEFVIDHDDAADLHIPDDFVSLRRQGHQSAPCYIERNRTTMGVWTSGTTLGPFTLELDPNSSLR